MRLAAIDRRLVGLAALVAFAACGRWNFDPVGDALEHDADVADAADDADADADAAIDADSGAYVVSSTQLTSMATPSFVDLEVDWPRSLAYISSREPGRCFEVVDFALVPPAIIERRGPPATGGSTCLGLLLAGGGDRLVVTSLGGDVVEVWDLGADPRAGVYTRLASVSVSGPRRIANAALTPHNMFVARSNSRPGLQIVDRSDTAPYLALGGEFNASPCVSHHNDLTHLASGLVLSGCSSDLSPVDSSTTVG